MLHGAGLAALAVSARALGLGPRQRVAAVCCGAHKTVALGLPLLRALLPPDALAAAAAAASVAASQTTTGRLSSRVSAAGLSSGIGMAVFPKCTTICNLTLFLLRLPDDLSGRSLALLSTPLLIYHPLQLLIGSALVPTWRSLAMDDPESELKPRGVL